LHVELQAEAAMVETSPKSEITDTPSRRQLGFEPGFTIDVRQVDDQNWTTLRALLYHGKVDDFPVPVDQRTDFASVPRAFVWFIPRYGRYTPAAILHDRLCRNEVPGRISRLEADGIFRQAMRELGVPFLRRWIMWAAVRLGALTSVDGRKEWWREAWRVGLIALFALPVVAPGAIVILLTIPVFYIFERAVWLPLELVRRARERRGRTAKKVNAPSQPWTL
jgi:hypothetical protein